MTLKPTALGADIFAGLFTHGVQQAGFQILGHLEHGDYGVATARLNFPGLDIRIGPENWNTRDFKGRVDFLYANCPCAAWSTMGANSRGGAQSWREPSQAGRLQYVRDVVAAGLAIRPKAWAWESVTNAWTHGRDFVLEQAREWLTAGYHVTVFLQDNQYLGVPQVRKRMFLISHQYPLVWPKLTKPITVREALAQAAQMKRLASNPDFSRMPDFHNLWKLSEKFGGNLRHVMADIERRTGKRYDKSRPLGAAARLRLDRPAPVMLEASKRWHPTESRILNWAEFLVLCGLPGSWKTSCATNGPATYELARAVMPPVGKWLATAVRNGLSQPKLPRKVACRVVDVRTGTFLEYPIDPTAPAVLDRITERPDETDDISGGPSRHAVSLATGAKLRPVTKAPSAPARPAPKIGAEPKTARTSRPGSGARIRELLVAGHDAESILATIRREFPQSKATKADVAWNRGRLKREGVTL